MSPHLCFLTRTAPSRSLRIALAFAAVWACWPAAPAAAQFSTATLWQSTGAGGQDANWNNAANWSTSTVPTASDDAQFTRGNGSCQLSANAVCHSLTVPASYTGHRRRRA